MELKPCPFCGGEARLHSYLLDAAVVCVRCGAEMSADHGAKLDDKTGNQRAIAAWNTRANHAQAEPVATAQDVAALVEALEASKQGWDNVVEMGLLPRQHHDTARDLSERARTAITKFGDKP